MALPALSKAYCSYVNYVVTSTPVGTTSRHIYWAFKAALLNQLGAPTAGTRHANSVWTCVGSSDGVTAALDGADRWLSSFDVTKIVCAGNTTAHSWIILQNTTLGVQLLLDANSATDQVCRLAMTPLGTPFTLNATPTYSPNTTALSFQHNVATDSTANAIPFVSNLSAGETQRISFMVDNSGEFYFVGHRSNFYAYQGGVAVLRPLGGAPSSPGVYFWGGKHASSGSAFSFGHWGWPASGGSTSYGGAFSRSYLGGVPQDGASRLYIGGDGSALRPGHGPYDSRRDDAPCDYNTGKSYYFRVEVCETDPLVYRGYFPDLYTVFGHAGIGVSFPTVASQTHVLMNIFAVPFIGAVPLIGA